MLGVLTLAACAPPAPTRFYTLSTMPPGEAPAAGRQVIGLGPIIVPDYLDRPELVSRRGENRLVLAEFDKWSEPLRGLFARVLRENLVALLGTQQVVLLPEPRDTRLDQRVEVEVIRFDADDKNQLVLDARWRVFDRGGERLVRTERSTIVERVASPTDYDAVTAAMSRATAKLGQGLAGALQPGARPAATGARW